MAPWLELPYDITDVTPEEDKVIKKCFIGYKKRFVKCGKPGYVMPGAFRKHAEAIYNFEVREDDVWVITFPRSGTTWTQEMVWLLENNLDYSAAQEKPLHERFPMLETTTQIPDVAFELIKANFMNLGNFQGVNKAVREPSWQTLEKMQSPRFIKTHMPLSLLPPKLLSTAKVIYVARDPRDVLVSYYYLHKMIAKQLLRASLKTYWEAYRRDLLPWCPVVSHANEAWEQRHNPNLHFLFYEDLIKDLPKEVYKISKFLNKDYGSKQIQELAQNLTFDSLRKNKSVNNTTSSKANGVQFIRKGEAGGWRTHFDAQMTAEADTFLTTRLSHTSIIYPSLSEKDELSHL